jgi:hypothetical protein
VRVLVTTAMWVPQMVTSQDRLQPMLFAMQFAPKPA